MKKIQVSVYLEPEVHEILSTLAKATHSSIGEILHKDAVLLSNRHVENGGYERAKQALQELEKVRVSFS